jgi:hypothetical protein
VYRIRITRQHRRKSMVTDDARLLFRVAPGSPQFGSKSQLSMSTDKRLLATWRGLGPYMVGYSVHAANRKLVVISAPTKIRGTPQHHIFNGGLWRSPPPSAFVGHQEMARPVRNDHLTRSAAHTILQRLLEC